MNVALIGPGLVGSEFIAQLSSSSHNLIAIASSSKMAFVSSLAAFKLSSTPLNIDSFLDFCQDNKPCVVIDSTSSPLIANLYPSILNRGLHIVTPNKKAFSSSMELYNDIKSAGVRNGGFVMHEASVGAGLPIISTLKDLVSTGDEIITIEGIFSGTLSYIFNNFSQPNAPSFSTIVKQAKELGYTEPDAREDLNGMDVGRKVCILARVAGMDVEFSSIAITDLVPAPLRSVPVSEFMDKLSEYDAEFEALNKEAAAKNSVLRYVGSISKDGYSASLKPYANDHPFAALKGSDNIISFTTRRFPQGLIVQGAGAGAAVTAFGMNADLHKIWTAVSGKPV